MDFPIIIFILLFLLVVILVFLHLANKKYAEKISVLEQALDMKADAITSLKETYEASQEAIARQALQENQIHEKDKVVRKIEEENKHLEEKTTQAYTEIQEYKQALDILKQEMQMQASHAEEIQNNKQLQLKELEYKYVSLEDSLEHKQQEYSALTQLHTQTITAHEEAKENYEKHLSDKNIEIESAQRQYKQLEEERQKELQNYEEKLHLKAAEMEKQREALTLSYEKEKAAYEAHLRQYQETISTQQKQLTHIEEEMNRALSKLDLIEKALARKEEAYQTLSEEKERYERIIAEFSDEYETIANTLRSTQEKLKKKEEAYATIEEEKAALSKVLNEEKHHLETLVQQSKTENETLSETLMSTQETLKQKEEAYRLLEEAKASLAKEFSEEKYQLDTLLQQSKTEYDTLSKTLMRTQEKLKEKEEAHAILEKEKTSLAKGFDKEKEALETMLQRSKVDYDVLSKTLISTQETLKDKEDAYEALEVEKVSLVKDFNHEKRALDTVLQQSKTDYDSLSQTLTITQERLKEKEEAHAILEKEQEKAYQSLSQSYHEKEEEITKISDTLAQITKEKAHISETYKALEESYAKEQKNIKTLRTSQQKEIEKLEKDYTKKQQALELKVKEYKEKYQENKKELDGLLSSKNKITEEHQIHIDTLKEQLSTAQKEADKNKNAYEAQVKILSDTQKDLEKKLNHTNDYVLELNEMHEAYVLETEKNIDTMETKNQAKEKELLALEATIREKENKITELDSMYDKILSRLNNEQTFLENSLHAHHESKEILQEGYDQIQQERSEVELPLPRVEPKEREHTVAKAENTVHNIQAKILEALEKGEDKKSIAKRFDIPLKRIELILKFDKIQKEKTRRTDT